MASAGTPESAMHFCGEPTADFDAAGEYLRTWYDANCPELHLGGWRQALRRWLRRALMGYRDYDLDRDRHHFMLGLINEVTRIEDERRRQVGATLNAETRMDACPTCRGYGRIPARTGETPESSAVPTGGAPHPPGAGDLADGGRP